MYFVSIQMESTMSEAIKEREQEKLVEALKGPHYYNISLQGYGAEACYMYISKEAFEFWSKHTEENGDQDAIKYIMNGEDKLPKEVNDIEDLEVEIPRDAMFMHDEDENEVGYNWYEPKEEFDRTWGVTLDANPRLVIDKVASEDFGADYIEDVYDDNLEEFIQKVDEDSNSEQEIWWEDHEYGNKYPEKGRYICQVVSEEKGTFFETTVETPTLFDQNKLKFAFAEAPNGEDLIYGVYYDGEEIYNEGGDTNGKGYYIYFYEQDF